MGVGVGVGWARVWARAWARVSRGRWRRGRWRGRWPPGSPRPPPYLPYISPTSPLYLVAAWKPAPARSMVSCPVMPTPMRISSMKAESTLLTPIETTKAHSARVKPGTCLELGLGLG